MRRVIAVAIGALVCACLVPKEQLDAALKDVEANGQKARSAEEQAAAADAKNKQLEVEKAQLAADNEGLKKQLEESQGNVARKEAEQRDLQAKYDELSKSSKQLAEAKAELEKKSSEYEGLAQSLKGEIQAGKVELSELKGKMTVKMKDKILFSSGSSLLGKEGQAALTKVAEALKDVKGKIIRVEGHTDNDPVDPKGNFPSNWHLSLARAMAVVQHLQDQGVDPGKLSVAGYGEFQPIVANDTPAHKSQNRRIEIVLAAGETSPYVQGIPGKMEPKGKGGAAKPKAAK
ncbi:MAG TPA: OmpA family protein [Myxococcaceae bacterium]|jgi:chemotaxis protein MotB